MSVHKVAFSPRLRRESLLFWVQSKIKLGGDLANFLCISEVSWAIWLQREKWKKEFGVHLESRLPNRIDLHIDEHTATVIRSIFAQIDKLDVESFSVSKEDIQKLKIKLEAMQPEGNISLSELEFMNMHDIVDAAGFVELSIDEDTCNDVSDKFYEIRNEVLLDKKSKGEEYFGKYLCSRMEIII